MFEGARLTWSPLVASMDVIVPLERAEAHGGPFRVELLTGQYALSCAVGALTMSLGVVCIDGPADTTVELGRGEMTIEVRDWTGKPLSEIEELYACVAGDPSLWVRRGKTTSEGGFYSLRFLSAAEYRVRVRAFGEWGECVIAVTDEQPKAAGTIRLPPMGTLSVSVTDRAQNGVPGAIVSVEDEDGVVREHVADSNGRVIARMGARLWRVSAHDAERRAAKTVTARIEAAGTTTVNLVLE
jgi:hypothetical protein